MFLKMLVLMIIGIEKTVGWALSHHFMHSTEDVRKDSKIVMTSER